jgi:hypothetical protein
VHRKVQMAVEIKSQDMEHSRTFRRFVRDAIRYE